MSSVSAYVPAKVGGAGHRRQPQHGRTLFWLWLVWFFDFAIARLWVQTAWRQRSGWRCVRHAVLKHNFPSGIADRLSS